MERITEKYGFCGNIVKDRYTAKDAIDRLAEYEDAEENGQLVRFPCKAGDKLWYISDYGEESAKIIECTVKSFHYDTHEQFEDNSIRCFDSNGSVVYIIFSQIGKSAFFTKKEAESALIGCREWIYHTERKSCGFCKYGNSFIGSAIICTKKAGCPAENMHDMFDTCDCKSFVPIEL